MFEDHAGAVWLGIDEKINGLRAGSFKEIKKSDGSAFDRRQNLRYHRRCGS